MAILKKLDLFRSIGLEHKDGTILGSLLTLFCVGFIVFFFSKEIKEYRSQKLATKLYVENLNAFMIEFSFDIVLLRLACDKVTLGLETAFDELRVQKTPFEEKGCQVTGRTVLKHMDNKLLVRPDMGSTLMDFMLLQGGGEEAAGKGIDMSHRVNRFQFGRSVDRVAALAERFPDIVQANPMDGLTFVSDDGKSGHSVFLYELNVVTAKIDGHIEIIYNYNKNTITSQNAQPGLTFIFDFSPVAVEYVQGSENFLEFVTYLLSIVGGILAIVKFGANLVLGLVRKPRGEAEQVMEMQ